ncbi:hypothetical protein CASFOL_011530 [Castilleja foliolosa]|uniref:Uncharacterized protein n=1 Tax=Castilleja foliolosa TaxID=1961234 RepID=A0ABD3DVR6_9LAMI
MQGQGDIEHDIVVGNDDGEDDRQRNYTKSNIDGNDIDIYSDSDVNTDSDGDPEGDGNVERGGVEEEFKYASFYIRLAAFIVGDCYRLLIYIED